MRMANAYIENFDKITFGKNLTEYMAKRGESIYTLSNKVGVHPSTLHRYKSGSVVPVPLIISKLAKELGITEDTLTGERSNPNIIYCVDCVYSDPELKSEGLFCTEHKKYCKHIKFCGLGKRKKDE